VCLVMRDPPDLKRGLDYICRNGTHSSNRTSLGESTLVADRCAMLGENATLVAALAGSFTVTMTAQWPSGLKHLRAIASLRHGDFAMALEDRLWLMHPDNDGDLPVPDLRHLMLEHLVLLRLVGRPPVDLAGLDAALSKAGLDDDPDDRIAHDYLTGRCDAGQARMWAASTGHPTNITYWLGLQAVAEHRFADARRDLAAASVGSTSTALTAAALLAWLDRQTPAQLDALPNSGAIPRRDARPAPSKRGANDF